MVSFREKCLVAAFLILPAAAFGQTVTPIRLVDAPTAGTLTRKTVLTESYLFGEGGVVQSVNVGIINLISVGCSYGGAGVVGAGKVTWQPHVAFQARIRIVEESLRAPGIAVGFDSQGFGPYAGGDSLNSLNRFSTKSRGVYLVMSRNYRLFGDFGLHAGANYSLETDDGDEDPSFWLGFDKNIGKIIEFCGEYDFATNDNDNRSMTANRGYLNGAVRWYLGAGFMFELDVKNILRNSKKDISRKDISGSHDERPEPSRELRFGYRRSF